MTRFLGIDFGHKRIGFAISDALGISARGLQTLNRRGGMADVQYIQDLVDRHQVGALVMGLPLSMDGQISDQAKQAQAFAKLLRSHLQLTVHWVDERLSSVQAEKLLRRSNSPTKEKGHVDQASACIILQQFLDTRAASDHDD